MICVTFPFSGLNHKLSAKTDPEQFPMNRKKSNPRKIATPLVQMTRGESHVYRRLLGAKVCRAKVHGAKVVGPKVRERSRPTRSPAPRRCWFLFWKSCSFVHWIKLLWYTSVWYYLTCPSFSCAFETNYSAIFVMYCITGLYLLCIVCMWM